MDYLLVVCVGLFAGTLSGVIGTGASLVLMPVLVVAFGPQQAVPIMAVGSIMGNLGKLLAWRRDIDWRACGAYSATAIPGAVLGVRTLLDLPPRWIEAALGAFFLAMIPLRRWLARQAWKLSLAQLALVGAPVGFLTGIVVSTGPITVPLFTAYGLERGAFLGTEAAGSLFVYLAKVGAFHGFGALLAANVLQGLLVGATLMAGAFVARAFVMRMSPATFRRLIDGLMFASGASLLWIAWR